jgi:hypothetical protein
VLGGALNRAPPFSSKGTRMFETLFLFIGDKFAAAKDALVAWLKQPGVYVALVIGFGIAVAVFQP